MNAAFCCASLGIVPTVRHADYIGSWLEVLREDNRVIVRAASAASKAADYILGYQREPEAAPVPSTDAGDPESARSDELRAHLPAIRPLGSSAISAANVSRAH